MNSLRFLLVHRDRAHSSRIADRLVRANHSVLPTSGLEEAADALTVERFDAILMDSEFRRTEPMKYGLPEFSAQLRRMEQHQKSATHIPLIAISDGPGDFAGGRLDVAESCVDAVMPEPLDPEALTAAVSRLARAVTGPIQEEDGSGDAQFAVLEVEKFREQVGFDSELMVEIIDIFLEERQRQEPEMRNALQTGNFELLSRVAHTIKGSLSSLHAMRARLNAQELETAAKLKNPQVCGGLLANLEADLAELEPELLALRQVSV